MKPMLIGRYKTELEGDKCLCWKAKQERAAWFWPYPDTKSAIGRAISSWKLWEQIA